MLNEDFFGFTSFSIDSAWLLIRNVSWLKRIAYNWFSISYHISNTKLWEYWGPIIEGKGNTSINASNPSNYASIFFASIGPKPSKYCTYIRAEDKDLKVVSFQILAWFKLPNTSKYWKLTFQILQCSQHHGSMVSKYCCTNNNASTKPLQSQDDQYSNLMISRSLLITR